MVSTVATRGALLVQVTTRFVRGLPLASTGVAVSWSPPPIGTDGAAGPTTTAATGTRSTVTVADALNPALAAVIVAVPGLRPVTRPPGSTAATVGAALTQVTGRLKRGTPFAFGVPLSCSADPTKTFPDVGETARLVAGGWGWQPPLPESAKVPPPAGTNAQL
jgi:hypothetical protein